ncbi:type II toxin-antitoxin system RelE/ParE family toxin [Telluria aromaticivorans]|uniref:Type II toxin-antitoxin system RelE/ParE family toxin n=1 Tax=Telluria aromaticivorans TaxID=2725995 RepID=A0A7Y2K3A1_9BURK|nr:type II toxin-antitoxin system RelE/ParE family toxin [Telluria aromaticivorans]NNG25538.1 type II toxin-antitoxin system RelE/ParE family toxin [Telluria aromaticivorans]
MEIRQHPEFQKFFAGVKDEVTKRMFLERIKRLAAGNSGDVGTVGEGVTKVRIHYGPGWRLYYIQSDAGIIVLLTGGTKRRQRQDIEVAKKLAREIRQ